MLGDPKEVLWIYLFLTYILKTIHYHYKIIYTCNQSQLTNTSNNAAWSLISLYCDSLTLISLCLKINNMHNTKWLNLVNRALFEILGKSRNHWGAFLALQSRW
jgi:hypothetical protein